jgi:hypothetical protein
MLALLHSLAMFVIDFFKSPRRLEAEKQGVGPTFRDARHAISSF